MVIMEQCELHANMHIVIVIVTTHIESLLATIDWNGIVSRREIRAPHMIFETNEKSNCESQTVEAA